MTGFKVNLVNRPGELARLFDGLAGQGISPLGFSGVAGGSIWLVTDDAEETRRILTDAYYLPVEVELVAVTLVDRPGTLAGVARRLGDAGVNIEAVLPAGRSGNTVTLAFATDDPAQARMMLAERVLAGVAS